MKQKRITSILITLAMLISLLPASIASAYEAGDPIEYIDYVQNGQYLQAQTATLNEVYEVVESNTTDWTKSWYVVKDNVTITSRISSGRANSEIHLILCNNAKLTLTKGLRVVSNSKLYIYAQSEKENVMGELDSTGYSGTDASAIGGDTGIGSGLVDGGETIINGGKITAVGATSAAGIGGGRGGSGTVTINGGIIKATGGSGAAGIGGGNNGGGEVTINGGTICATGGGGGAGIGSGNNGGIGTVTINGGSTEATGGVYSAGIGGGDAAVGTVTINGGTVYASGGQNGAGIGSGGNAVDLPVSVQINGGNVGAFGGQGADDIGLGAGNVGTAFSLTSRWGSDPELKIYGLVGIFGDKRVSSVEGTTVSGPNFFAQCYGLNDIYTFENGRLHFMIPQRFSGVKVVRITMEDGQIFEPGDGDAQSEPNVYLHCTHAKMSGKLCAYCGENPSGGDSGTGEDTDNVYEISDYDELVEFSEFVNSGHTAVEAVLTNDITEPVTGDFTIGTSKNAYMGTFDGQGHEINVNLTGGEITALFSYVAGATIKNLTVKGDVTASGQRASGLVGDLNDGDTRIENCISSVNISASTEGEGIHGGLVADARAGSLTIENCAFVGGICGKDLTGCGGLVGETSVSTAISNSYVDANFDGFAENSESNTIARNPQNVSITNCYYTEALGEVPDEAVCIEQYQCQNGTLAFLLNGSVSGGTRWYQNIDNDDAVDEYPVPYSTHGMVYRGYRSCYDTEAYYSNTEISQAEEGHGAPVYTVNDETDTITCNCADCGDNGKVWLEAEDKIYDGAALTYTCVRTGIMQYDYTFIAYGCCEGGCKNVGEHSIVMGNGDLTVTKKVRILSADKFCVLKTGQEDGNTTATIYFPTGGTYTVVFADYDGEVFKAVETVEVTVTDGETSVVKTKKGLALGKDDRVMLWNNLSDFVPMCGVYKIN